ncbi:MAG: hypothetical protein U0359_35355 [Byssovorax sp.]
MKRAGLIVLVCGALGALGCSGDNVGSEEDAKRAYQGLDASIDKAIDLGFDGFNAAKSANIDPQETKGAKTGTMTIGGKVDQGASNNKTMNLTETLVMYSDDGKLTYDTGATLPTIDMKLSKIPDGTLSGTLSGDFTLSGDDLKGPVTLSLTFNGDLQAGSGTAVVRKPGTTHITGTATSDYGTYNVDITR